MRTPVDKPKALTLGELMRISGKLRRSGYASGSPSDRFSPQQLGRAVTSFIRYRQLTRMALMVYIMFLVLVLGSYFFSTGFYTLGLSALCFLGFLVFLGRSSRHKSDFYTAIGRQRNGQPALYSLLGLPLYFLIYFRLEKSMRMELSEVFRNSVPNPTT